MELKIILLVAFCAWLGAIGQIFFKLASETLKFDFIALITNWKLFLGLTLYGIATILFLIALKHSNLSIAYPIIATSYVWVTILSKVFLNEPFPSYKWIGIIMIIMAVGVITR